MRNFDQLLAARSEHLMRIQALEEEDAKFPDEPIYENTIASVREAIAYLDRRIADLTGE